DDAEAALVERVRLRGQKHLAVRLVREVARRERVPRGPQIARRAAREGEVHAARDDARDGLVVGPRRGILGAARAAEHRRSETHERPEDALHAVFLPESGRSAAPRAPSPPSATAAPNPRSRAFAHLDRETRTDTDLGCPALDLPRPRDTSRPALAEAWKKVL